MNISRQTLALRFAPPCMLVAVDFHCRVKIYVRRKTYDANFHCCGNKFSSQTNYLKVEAMTFQKTG